MLSSGTAWAQLISLLVGIVSTIVTISSNMKALRQPQANKGAGAQSLAPDTGALNFPGDPQRQPQDLITALLIAAVLSLTVIDALVVLNQSAGIDEFALLLALLISSLISFLCVVSWYFGAEDRTFVGLGFATLFVLVLARGGPLRPSEYQIPSEGTGLLFFAPLFAISTILSTYLIYIFGEHVKRRRLFWILLLTPAMISAAAQGQRFLHDVRSDIRTPHTLSSNAAGLLKRLEALGHRDVVKFFPIASETVLSSLYTDANARARHGISLVNRSGEIGSDSNPRFAAETVDRIGSTFAVLPQDSQNAYLLARLRWIYPLGAANAFQAPIGLPGLTTLQRLQTTGALRNVTLLSERETERQSFLQSFTYPPEVNNAFRSALPKSDKDVDPFLAQVLGIDQPEPVSSVPDLFPSEDPASSNSEFINQLTLPQNEDLPIARDEYSRTAMGQLVKDSPESLPLLTDFEGLDQSSKDAFIHYVGQSQHPADIVAALSSAADIDFSPVLSLKLTSPMSTVATAIENLPANPTNSVDAPESTKQEVSGDDKTVEAPKNKAPNNVGQSEYSKQAQSEPIVTIARAIVDRTTDSRPKRAALIELLRKQDDQVPVNNLFGGATLRLARRISSTLSADQQVKALKSICDPINTVLGKAVVTNDSFADIRAVYSNFITLPDTDKEDILHYLAIRLYRTDGPFALNPLKQTIVQATSLNVILGFLSSFIVFLPLFLGGLFIGYLGSQKLNLRDALRNNIREELEQPEPILVETELVGLQGRRDEILRLDRLTTRNRATIALTGRRGSGKSRILREVFRSELNVGNLALWIDSPSKYTHDDFVASLLERLAASVESAIARFMGFPRRSVRSLEQSCLRQVSWLFLFLIISLALISYAILSGLTRPEVMVLWSPVGLLLIPAIAYFVIELYRVNPSGVGGTMSRKAPYHTRVLYDTALEAFHSLQSRGNANAGALVLASAMSIRLIALIVIGVYTAAVAAPLFVPSKSSSLTNAIMGIIGRSGIERQRMVECLLLVAIWTVVYSIKHPFRDMIDRESTPGLIQRYRRFAKEVVFRISKGALGGQGSGIVVCIDELDKITDLAELKAFLNLAKTLFDIDGVTYYLSMADNALVSLSLGSAVGKDEFDSSFDHVELIPPLSLGDSSLVAAQYMNEQLRLSSSPEVEIVIGFLSFGIPRDIVRKCETAFASGILSDAVLEKTAELFRLERQDKATAGRALGHISGAEAQELSSDLFSAERCVRDALEITADQKSQLKEEWHLPEARLRLLALVAILVLGEKLLRSVAQEKLLDNREFESLFRAGFEVSSMPIQDVWLSVRRAWEKLNAIQDTQDLKIEGLDDYRPI